MSPSRTWEFKRIKHVDLTITHVDLNINDWDLATRNVSAKMDKPTMIWGLNRVGILANNMICVCHGLSSFMRKFQVH